MRELAVQAANDTLTSQDRGYIQLEIDQLKEEVSRISTTTQFNKKKLLDGSAAVLWSSDKLETKAFIRGALRQIDQFGQKSAAEGNFKISIIADPGQAEVKKTDIFKIKHPNVIMNVSKNVERGVQNIRVDNLPAGTYNITETGAARFGWAVHQQFGTTAALVGRFHRYLYRRSFRSFGGFRSQHFTNVDLQGDVNVLNTTGTVYLTRQSDD